jgi:hypothetical protein
MRYSEPLPNGVLFFCIQPKMQGSADYIFVCDVATITLMSRGVIAEKEEETPSFKDHD